MIKLNLGGVEEFEGGSGSPRLVDFTNIDICPNLRGVDIVCDIANLPMFKDISVDEIRVSHAIEHLPLDKIDLALKEWHRILIPNGLLRIYCPDAKKIAQDFVENKIDCVKYSRLLFGNQDYKENYHLLAIDRQRLDELVISAGFKIIGRDPRPNAYPYDLGVQAKK
jgi:predicted SAM-dependent methyltransferase